MGEKEIKRVMVVEREGMGGRGGGVEGVRGGGREASRLLVQPSAFFATGPGCSKLG